MDLTSLQTRVIGCLLEKEITTPDQYPLSLNGLTTACNQKSNRESVLSLDESEVQNILDELKEKRLVRDESGFGSRVSKFKHRFCNTEFSDLQFTAQQLAVICVLFLRGPQTPGELRTRTNRLCEFKDVSEVETTLTSLADHPMGSLVQRLAREPGKRESRYVHLFSGAVEDADVEMAGTDTDDHNLTLQQRIARLEQEVADLKQEIMTLKNSSDID
ncbi:YceH family protein [Neptuniibacter sp. QD57_21]|uniref:YceH family protein n=1 Tax=Neptuniibacter sp. QD57_21 TaxID=3398213 RepID=UPI0039F5AD97